MAAIDWDSLSRVIDVFSSPEYTPILHEFLPWMVDRLDDADLEPDSFVDVGCGTALLAAKLVDWYPEATLTLVDANTAMLARARERLADFELARFVEADALVALDGLEPESVDVLIFCRSFYALTKPVKTAARAVEVLRPGGRVFLFDFTRIFDLAQLDAFYGEIEPVRWPQCRTLMVDFLEGIAEQRYRVYPEPELSALWRAAGAELVAYESHEPAFPNHRACYVKG